MDENLKTLYIYLLKYKWHVSKQWKEDGDVVFIVAPLGPIAHPFRVRLTPKGDTDGPTVTRAIC